MIRSYLMNGSTFNHSLSELKETYALNIVVSIIWACLLFANTLKKLSLQIKN